MDILDILLAKKKSFTGETEKLVRQANEAMAAANDVAEKINDAEDLLATAQQANTLAQNAADAFEQMQEDINTSVGNIVDNKISNITTDVNSLKSSTVTSVTVEDNNTSSYKSRRAKVRKNNTDTNYDISKNYTSTGQNEDGAMTQKAITNALNALDNKINNIPSGSGSSGNISGNVTIEDAGNIVIVGADGNIEASTISEEDLIKTQIILGTYITTSAVGIEIDYENKTINRIQAAQYLSAGNDFNQYAMFGGRKRCLVADDGEILAFYGEENYIEDGSLGQIMVYQPKFYYLRAPLQIGREGNNEIIQKEIILLSDIKQAGFTIHPLFKDDNGQELEYVLLSAYEGCAFNPSTNTYNLNDNQNVDFQNDYLSSIAGAKPISGASQSFTVSVAQQLANNRGEGWKITDLAAESVNQLLMIVEFNSLNLQNTFNKGLSTLSDFGNSNASCITGSTSALGSNTGMAAQTIQTYGNSSNTFDAEGKCAISYRGFENPYGNIWRFIGDTKVNGSTLIYKGQAFSTELTKSSNWISNFGYDKEMSWAMLPAKAINANSAVPVGDYVYVSSSLSGDKCCVVGGKWSATDYVGPFYYGFDYAYDRYAHSYSARLMYIPTPNTQIYLNNIQKWENAGGGELQ